MPIGAPATTMLCTVGTSLLGNLRWPESGGAVSQDLADALGRREWRRVGELLRSVDPADRICGAEINSCESAFRRGYVDRAARILVFHSDTDEGRNTGAILRTFYEGRPEGAVDLCQVDELQDDDPRRFRTHGLRNLAKKLCGALLEYGHERAAINATGGYKAQVAIAVLLGQVMRVPVFYKHERFDEIISFPPLPVALDSLIWSKHSGLLLALDRSKEPFPLSSIEEELDEVVEPLIERTPIDGEVYVDLSPVGQIFHQAFEARFRREAPMLLPPAVAAAEKRRPRLENAGWVGEHPEVEAFMASVTDEVPEVVQCATHYYNPDLAMRTRFRLGAHGVEGVFSPSGYCVRFRVESRARSVEQQAALTAALNRWLDARERSGHGRA